MPAASAQAQAGPRARTPSVACTTLASSFLLACCATAPVAHTTTPPASALTDQIRAVPQKAWAGYTKTFIEPDGRVMDPTRGGVTTSEGLGYALLRATWMGDRQVFETVCSWTAANLELPTDGHFASLWSDGRIADSHSASDADSDIALALLYAARRLGSTAPHADALRVLGAIWRGEVVSINHMNTLTAGNWAKTQVSPGPVINPSYFTLLVTDPAGAAQIQRLLLATFHSSPAYFGDPQNYFEQNWVWFGLALSAGVLVDLDRVGA